MGRGAAGFPGRTSGCWRAWPGKGPRSPLSTPGHVIRGEHIGWRTRCVAQRRRGPPAPGAGRFRHLRRWPWWVCAPISRPVAPATTTGRRDPRPLPGHADDRAGTADGYHRASHEGRLRRTPAPVVRVPFATTRAPGVLRLRARPGRARSRPAWSALACQLGYLPCLLSAGKHRGLTFIPRSSHLVAVLTSGCGQLIEERCAMRHAAEDRQPT